MKYRSKRKKRWIAADLLTILLCFLFAFPLLVGFLNSFKPLTDIIFKPLEVETSRFTLDGYAVAISSLKYGKRFLNSTILTVSSVVLSMLMTSMTAFKLTRDDTRLSKGVFKGITLFMLIPFNCTMISMTVIMTRLGLLDTYAGAILGYLSYLAPMAIFLYRGYILSVPVALDESAIIDGCSTFGIYWYIVFPLLAPMTATVVILNTFRVWNDYLYPLLMLQSESKKTLVTGLSYFSSNHMKQWDKLLAATVLVIAPVFTVYIAMQKYIISGMVTGAVKG